MQKAIERSSGKKGVRIEFDGYGDQLLGMRNGYQWSGQPICLELAEMMIEALSEYVELQTERRLKGER